MNGQKSTSDLHLYYTCCSDITFCESILQKNEWIIAPTILPEEMKPNIHQGHSRIESRKKSARQSLFWPLINCEIEDMIKKWTTCLTFQNHQPNEPIANQQNPKRALKKLMKIFLSYMGITIY